MIGKKEYVRQHLDRLITLRDSIKTDDVLVKEILNDHLKHIPKMKLYKYRCCLDQNFNALSSQDIWMSKPDEFNDLFDCTINIDLKRNYQKIQQWFRENNVEIVTNMLNSAYRKNRLPFDINVEVVQEVAARFFTPTGHLMQKKLDDFINSNYDESEISIFKNTINDLETFFSPDNTDKIASFIGVVNEQRNHARTAMLVYSMTEDYNNYSMWENYADRYQGFCIEYSFHDFGKHKFDNYKNLIYLLPVSYFKRIPYYDIVPMLNHSLLMDQTVELEREQIIQLNLQLLNKNKSYEYEKEWRFSIKNENNKMQHFPFVSKLLAGWNISDENFNKLNAIADKLSVPIVRQKVDNVRQRFVYM